MDWFEQVKDTVKKTAAAAYDKSGQLVDITKLKLSLTTAEGAAEKLYKEIGELAYKNAKNGTVSEEILKGLYEAVDAKLAEIEELKSRIAAIKNLKKCTGCGKQIEDNAVFCPACGKKVEETVEVTEETTEE